MLRNKRNEAIVALLLVAPFVAIYGLIFIYPTIRLLIISFQDAPLIGSGEVVGTAVRLGASGTVPPARKRGRSCICMTRACWCCCMSTTTTTTADSRRDSAGPSTAATERELFAVAMGHDWNSAAATV